MYIRSLVILISTLISQATSAQQVRPGNDSIPSKDLEEVVVTATRTERKLGNLAIPTTVVSKAAIQLSGSLRLNDILQEQTGLFITGGTGSNAVGGGVFGNGIQMQGLSPDHTMILLDGEPLIGRQGGVMDLSRFAVGNIRKIEIVKGPSSSLYGSEAMGGVINIITEPLTGKQWNAGMRLGSFFTTDLYTSGNRTGKKAALYYFLNRNGSRGYDLDAGTIEKTQDPFCNYTGHIKWSYNFSPKTKLICNTRTFYSHQKSAYAINSKEINVAGSGQVHDFTINPVLKHRFSNAVNNTFRVLISSYRFTQKLDSVRNGAVYYRDDFRQGFYRVENQSDVELNKNNTLSVGGGFTLQTVETTRYREKKQQQMWHAFLQEEWRGVKNLSVITGLRYDYNTDFVARFSPKLAVAYSISENFKINASYGAGFKAPDFRQLYLSFVNNAAEGYSIFGANEFSIDRLELQKQQGLIVSILPAAYQITKLKPEISRGFNFGAQWIIHQKWKCDVNVFRNDINNLINYVAVANNSNETSVFSYVNINRAFTQGTELNINFQCSKNVSVTCGYQYLSTADKSIREKVKSGTVYGRNAQYGSARLMELKDYSGLFNRSRHMANLRIFYNHVASGWSASLRCIYRSRFGVIDKDGNGFANMSEEFAQGVLQLHATVAKQIGKRISMQAGVNNLLNQVNPRFMPNVPGINGFIALSYTCKK